MNGRTHGMLDGSNVRLVSVDSGLEKLGRVESFVGDRLSLAGDDHEGLLDLDSVWVEAYAHETVVMGQGRVVSADGQTASVALSRAAMPRFTSLQLTVVPNCLTGQFDNRLFFITGLGPNAFSYASGGSLAETSVVPVLARSLTGSVCVRVTVEREESVCNVFRGCAALKELSVEEYEIWQRMCIETGHVPREMFAWNDVREDRAA